MKYKDKYNKSVELPLSDISEREKVVIGALMREGELRFRDALIEVMQMMKRTGGIEQISVDAVIEIVETLEITGLED